MVGKELLEISDNPLLAKPERVILSTYVPPSANNSDGETDNESVAQSSTQAESDTQEEDFEDALDEIEKAAAAEMKSVRPNLDEFEDAAEDEEAQSKQNDAGEHVDEDVASEVENVAEEDVDSEHVAEETAENETEEAAENEAEEKIEKEAEKTAEDGEKGAGRDNEVVEGRNGVANHIENEESTKNDDQPRNRFKDSLSALQIEEAKATGRAQLGLAFELLTMMKKRGLKADPEAYQCLIDACGRVGDTKRATELLAKMHEDGIVADGVVYSCLVSAFSAESAWKQVSGEQAEDLPGMCCP